MRLKYTMVIQWSDEDQLYLVSFPEFPEQKFITHGKTYQEAAQNGQEAIKGLIAVLQDNGLEHAPEKPRRSPQVPSMAMPAPTT